MTVNSFDPSAEKAPIPPELPGRLLALNTSSDALELSDHDAMEFGKYATHPQWAEAAEKFGDDEVVRLIRVFTLGEMRYAGWQAGDKSPVIALVRILKEREAYTKELGAWIKSHTTNRYLPHGSLLDRL